MTTATSTSADHLTKALSHGEAGHFRFGALPDYHGYYRTRMSYNHRDGAYEDGVSVYAGWLVGEELILDLRECDGASALFILNSTDAYRAEGALLVDRGADNEPLMYDDGEGRTIKTTKISVSAVNVVLV